MIDQVFGRELPPMQDWSQALLDEAIRCKVQFGALLPGQGMVTAQLVRVIPAAKLTFMMVTYDPRDAMTGVEVPVEMRFVGEIRHPANNFSLMRPPVTRARAAATKQAARKLIARARSDSATAVRHKSAKRFVRATAPTKRPA